MRRMGAAAADRGRGISARDLDKGDGPRGGLQMQSVPRREEGSEKGTSGARSSTGKGKEAG